MGFMEMAKTAATGYLGAKGAGLAGGTAMGVLMDLIEKNGGVSGVIEKFEEASLGAQVQSWLANGANHPIDAAQVEKVFGLPQIQTIAKQFNLNAAEISGSIAGFLPQLIDALSPNGKVSARGFDPSELLSIGRSILGR